MNAKWCGYRNRFKCSLDELQAIEVIRETAERSRAQRVCDYQQKGGQPYVGKDNFEIKV